MLERLAPICGLFILVACTTPEKPAEISSPADPDLAETFTAGQVVLATCDDLFRHLAQVEYINKEGMVNLVFKSSQSQCKNGLYLPTDAISYKPKTKTIREHDRQIYSVNQTVLVDCFEDTTLRLGTIKELNQGQWANLHFDDTNTEKACGGQKFLPLDRLQHYSPSPLVNYENKVYEVGNTVPFLCETKSADAQIDDLTNDGWVKLRFQTQSDHHVCNQAYIRMEDIIQHDTSIAH